MKDKIIKSPLTEDAEMLYSEFECDNNDIIALSDEDFVETVRDASSVVTIEKCACGSDRLNVALCDIKDAFENVAPGLNLLNADRFLCLIVVNEDFRIKEMDYLTEFFKGFSNETNIIWGVSRKKNSSSINVTVRLLAAFK